MGDRVADVGTIWCEGDDKFYCWDANVHLDRQEGEERFVAIFSYLLPFLLPCAKEVRVRTCLTGQLDSVMFNPGEKVLVRKKEGLTGDPFEDLQASIIEKTHNGLIFVKDVSSLMLRLCSTVFYECFCPSL